MQTRDATNKVGIVRLVPWWCVYPMDFAVFVIIYSRLLLIFCCSTEQRTTFAIRFIIFIAPFGVILSLFI